MATDRSSREVSLTPAASCSLFDPLVRKINFAKKLIMARGAGYQHDCSLLARKFVGWGRTIVCEREKKKESIGAPPSLIALLDPIHLLLFLLLLRGIHGNPHDGKTYRFSLWIPLALFTLSLSLCSGALSEELFQESPTPLCSMLPTRSLFHSLLFFNLNLLRGSLIHSTLCWRVYSSLLALLVAAFTKDLFLKRHGVVMIVILDDYASLSLNLYFKI